MEGRNDGSGECFIPQLPKFPDEVKAAEALFKHVDFLGERVEKHLNFSEETESRQCQQADVSATECTAGSLGENDEDERMPGALSAMTEWKRARDTKLRKILSDTVTVAEQQKKEGNDFFRQGKYEAAYEAYKNGVDHLAEFSEGILDPSARKLNVTLCCNASLALIKSGVDGATSDGARMMAEKALALEPTNVKALFRRGLAYANGGDTNLARDDLQQVLRLEPENAAARQELKRLRTSRKGRVSTVASRGWDHEDGSIQGKDSKPSPEPKQVATVKEVAQNYWKRVLESAEGVGLGQEWTDRLRRFSEEGNSWAEDVLRDSSRAAALSLALGPACAALNLDHRAQVLAVARSMRQASWHHAKELNWLLRSRTGDSEVKVPRVSVAEELSREESREADAANVLNGEAVDQLYADGFVVLDVNHYLGGSEGLAKLHQELQALDDIGALQAPLCPHPLGGDGVLPLHPAPFLGDDVRLGAISLGHLEAWLKPQTAALWVAYVLLLRQVPAAMRRLATGAALTHDDLELKTPFQLLVVCWERGMLGGGRRKSAFSPRVNSGKFNAVLFVSDAPSSTDNHGGGGIAFFTGEAPDAAELQVVQPSPGQLLIYAPERLWHEALPLPRSCIDRNFQVHCEITV